ncbi:MAG: hypothetical protein IKP77_02915 [Acholeplasmatales bacterium]|nr:hypothetical protein [Acholeplasmatales bacterium]
MIDIHTHILYGVDDGSPNSETSKFLIDEEIKNGVKKIILTPHQNEECKRTIELIERFESFKNEFKDYNIDFYLGSEIYYYSNMIDDLKRNELLTINNTKYVLVEFSTDIETDISSIIYDLKINGYLPIVAHIERYPYLSLKDYDEIKKNGALIQVNSKSFERKIYNKRLKYLMKKNLVDFISSDCHNEKRNCDFEFTKRFIAKKYKKQYDKYFNDDFIFE